VNPDSPGFRYGHGKRKKVHCHFDSDSQELPPEWMALEKAPLWQSRLEDPKRKEDASVVEKALALAAWPGVFYSATPPLP